MAIDQDSLNAWQMAGKFWKWQFWLAVPNSTCEVWKPHWKTKQKFGNIKLIYKDPYTDPQLGLLQHTCIPHSDRVCMHACMQGSHHATQSSPADQSFKFLGLSCWSSHRRFLAFQLLWRTPWAMARLKTPLSSCVLSFALPRWGKIMDVPIPTLHMQIRYWMQKFPAQCAALTLKVLVPREWELLIIMWTQREFSTAAGHSSISVQFHTFILWNFAHSQCHAWQSDCLFLAVWLKTSYASVTQWTSCVWSCADINIGYEQCGWCWLGIAGWVETWLECQRKQTHGVPLFAVSFQSTPVICIPVYQVPDISCFSELQS